MKNITIAAATLALALGGTATLPAAAAPTPMPGGAYQLKGVTGTLSSTLFNGKLRLRKFVLRRSTPDEQKPDPGANALTLTYVVLDGTNSNAHGSVSATMADADGVVLNGHPAGVYGAYYDLVPGAGAAGKLIFMLPAGFVPVKILLTATDGIAMRITLKPSDVPAPAPTPAPSVTP